MKDLSCPKCGFKREPGTVECPRCGIIFKKYEMVQRRKLEAANVKIEKKSVFMSVVMSIIPFDWLFRKKSFKKTDKIQHEDPNCLKSKVKTEEQGALSELKSDKQVNFGRPKTDIKINKNLTISPPVKSHPSKQEKVRIINKKETSSTILFTIHIQVDKFDSHKLFCEIDKNGSPWVTVDATHFDEPGESFQYNARHARWKDRLETPFWIEKGIQKATQLIRNEWNEARRRYGWEFETRKRNSVTADISTKEIIFTYDQDQLKKLDDHIEVQGSEKKPYQINLQKLSCTCPDFKKRRSEFSEGDIRRVCKHQADVIIATKQNMKITDDIRIQNIIRGSRDRGFQVFDKCIEVTFNESVIGPNPFYIFLKTDEDWINVVYFSTRSFTMSGYNTIEKRWAYNRSNPFPSGYKRKYDKAIKKAISSI